MELIAFFTVVGLLAWICSRCAQDSSAKTPLPKPAPQNGRQSGKQTALDACVGMALGGTFDSLISDHYEDWACELNDAYVCHFEDDDGEISFEETDDIDDGDFELM